MATTAVVGQAGNKDFSLAWKLSGKLDYAADNWPGTKLFAKTLLSTIAHGTITSIDTSAAEALEGVKAVCTYKDNPQWSSTILWWGQEVAGVAAVTEEIAMQALALIKVVYAPLTAIVDPDDAAKTGAALTGVWADTNVRTTDTNRGDVNAGFQKADVVVSDTIGWTNRFQHQEPETHTVVARWIDDRVFLWIGGQTVWAQRTAVSTQLKMPLSKVRVVSHGTGGGHGDKSSGEWCVTASVLAKKAGMAVMYNKSRFEHTLCAFRQHQAKADFKIGVKNDGTIVAFDCTFYGDAGGNGAAWAGGLSWPIRSTWICPDMHVKHVDIATNSNPTSAWRCVADPPGQALTNLMFYEVAAKLNMDPLALMKKNIIVAGMKHQDTGLVMASVGVGECLQKAADGIGYAGKYHAPGAGPTRSDGRLHGIGITACYDSHGQLSTAVSAIVNLTKDGKCLMASGQTNAAGSINSTRHFVAETLGMAYEDVVVGEWGNTDSTSEGGTEGGSTRTTTLGAAFVMAAQDALTQALTAGISLFPGLTVDKLSVGGGKVFETANPTNSKTWAEVAAKFVAGIVGRGTTWAKKLRRPVGSYPIGTDCEVRGQEAAAAEILVDPETGEIELLSFCNAIDVGKAAYLRGCEKQMFGGIEIQHHEALGFEQIIEKSTGATLNQTQLTQGMQTSLDMRQDRFSIAIVESDDAAGPYGAHGIGEPCVNSYGVFAAAFYNATGKVIKASPLTPARVLQALGKI